MRKKKKKSDYLLKEDGGLHPFIDVELVGLCAAVNVGMPPDFLAREILRMSELANWVIEMQMRRETALKSKF